MARRGRRSAAAAAAIRLGTPATPLPGDEDMQDANEESPAQEDVDDAEVEAATPAQDSEQNQDPDEDADQEQEQDPDHDHVSDASGPGFPFYRATQVKRRRPGRPPRNRPTEPDRSTPGGDDGSDAGTPQRRRRGRPAGAAWRGGSRGRARAGTRGGFAQSNRQAIDKEGNMMDIVDDELALPEDPEGETKVDKNGYLQGHRDYRVRTFTIFGRGDRLYMLSTEPARCTGFRDSYLFFTKHLQLYKIIISDDEKRDLIDRDLIPHSYKGRSIGIVTARSVFREFGARIIVGGKKIIDDYAVAQGRARGDVEGELADPHDRLPAGGEQYNKNQYVAWHGASSVYHNNAPSVPLPSGRPIVPGKRKPVITSANWQFEHAREASRYNTSLAALRRDTLDGIYDPHTNQMLLPRITQPTNARWEMLHLPPAADSPARNAGFMVNGTSSHPGLPNGFSASASTSTAELLPPSHFGPVSNLLSRNYLIVDAHFDTPPHPSFPLPGPDGPTGDIGHTAGLPDLSAQDLEDLPLGCREAFETAKNAEIEWRGRWGGEVKDGLRCALRIGVGAMP